MVLDQLPPDGTVPAPCDPDAVVPGRSRRFDRWVVWTALGLSLLPLAVAAAVLAASAGDVRPVGDLALTELRVRDVPSHLPLTGPYSRDGWHHPGPALFYLLAPLYWLAGGASVNLWVGALLVNGASIAGMGLVARRRGGIAALLCILVACALLVRALGFEFLGIPWNPYVTVLPHGLLVVLTWAMLCGDRWALPVGAGVATFLAQTHVGNVVLALPLVVLGAAGLLLADRAAGQARRSWHAIALAAGVGAVAWLPPAIDQLTSEPGNLGEILTWFRASRARAHTLVEGWNVVSAQYWLAPEWLRGERPVDVVPAYLDHPLVPLLLVVVGAAAVAAWRRRAAASERRLFVAWAVASVLGVLSVARTVDEVFGYRLRWSWMLAAIAAAASGWVAWTAAVRRWPASERRVLVPAALVGLASLAALNSAAAVREGAPQDEASTAIAALMPQLLDALPPGDGPIVVSAAGGLRGFGYRNGVVLDLERRGIEARVPSSDALGGHRAHDGRPVRATLTVVADSQILSFLGRDGWEQVAYAGPAPLAVMTEELSRQQEVVERFERGELALDEAYRELESPLTGQTMVGVFLQRPEGR